MGFLLRSFPFEKRFKPMFSVLCKKQLIRAASNVRGFRGPPRFLELPQNATSVKSESPEILSNQRQSLTVSYLINTCGLSPEAANVASKKVSLRTPEKPDLLLTLLRNHRFGDVHIRKMVTKLPSILLAHPEKTVLPKLQFFHSIGMPAPVLAEIISRNPIILRSSLQNRIIPFYDYLKNLLQIDEKVIAVFKRSTNCFMQTALKRLRPNVAILKKYGMSKSYILFFVVQHPTSLLMRSDELVKLVDRVIGLGIDISKLIFVQAIHALYCMSKSAWEHKEKAYCRWGWSESDVYMAFSIHPLCMSLSEKNITSAMEFLVNEMNCQPKAIARCPTVLLYSLEKRVVPRCRVFKLLMVKGLIKKSYSLVTLLVMTDENFLERFVRKYQNVPQLLDVYSGKLGLLELGFNSCELAKVKLL